MSDPQIPAALAPAVVGVVSLHDFKPQAQHAPKAPQSSFTAGSGIFYAGARRSRDDLQFQSALSTPATAARGRPSFVLEPTRFVRQTAIGPRSAKAFGLSGLRCGLVDHDSIRRRRLRAGPTAPIRGTHNDGNDTAKRHSTWNMRVPPRRSAAIVVASCEGTDTIDPELTAMQNLTNSAEPAQTSSATATAMCEAENGAADTAAFGAIYQQGVAEGISILRRRRGPGCVVMRRRRRRHACTRPSTASASMPRRPRPMHVATGGTDFSDTYFRNQSVRIGTSTNSTNLWLGPLLHPGNSVEQHVRQRADRDLPMASPPHTESSGFCNSTAAAHLFGDLSNTGGSGGPSGCATGSPSIPWRGQRHLPGMAEAVLAKRLSGQSSRRRARYTRTCRCSPPTARGIMFTSTATPTPDPAASMRALPLARALSQWSDVRRHLVHGADLGRHPGAGEPIHRIGAGPAQLRLLQDRGRRIRRERQQQLQFQQRQRDRRQLRLL